MAKKAKITLVNETSHIVDKTVEEVNAALAKGGLVSFPVTKKVYITEPLSTINIGEKQEPAYKFEAAEISIAADRVASVSEAKADEAEVYTGSSEVEVVDEDEQPEG